MLFGKKTIADRQLIEMIRGTEREREAALRFIYVESGWRPLARRVIRARGAGEQDAEDAIQEAMIVLDNHVRNFKFQHESGLKNYFIGICKGRWYSNRRSVQRIDWSDQPVPADAADSLEPEVIMLQTEQKTMVRRMLRQLDDRCRELLRLYKLSYSMEEISAEMELGSANNARQRVHQCREKLTKMIASTPLFDELKQP